MRDARQGDTIAGKGETRHPKIVDQLSQIGEFEKYQYSTVSGDMNWGSRRDGGASEPDPRRDHSHCRRYWLRHDGSAESFERQPDDKDEG